MGVPPRFGGPHGRTRRGAGRIRRCVVQNPDPYHGGHHQRRHASGSSDSYGSATASEVSLRDLFVVPLPKAVARARRPRCSDLLDRPKNSEWSKAVMKITFNCRGMAACQSPIRLASRQGRAGMGVNRGRNCSRCAAGFGGCAVCRVMCSLCGFERNQGSFVCAHSKIGVRATPASQLVSSLSSAT